MYSKARGALTLESIGLTARNDSGIVETMDNRIVGMAQSAGVTGIAYVFPYQFLHDQVLVRVLDRNGTVPAGWLGVVPEPGGSARGVVVKEIQPKSTAEACGLQAKDVIVGLDQYDITGQAEMAAVLSAFPAGRKIRLRALRGQTPVEMDAVLGAQPVQPIIAWTPTPTPTATSSSLTEESLPGGFVARELTEQLARYFGVKSGMLITEVSKGSPADKAGLAAGDVVIAADDQDLAAVQQLKSILLIRQRTVKLKVFRNRSLVLVNLSSVP